MSMSLKFFSNGLVLLSVARCVSSAVYSASSTLTGENFANAFNWVANADPNWGRVNYVDRATADATGLLSVSGNQVTFRADSTTVLSPSGPGRNSFDLVSIQSYTTHVAIFDIVHMPEGCGTWPAELGANWPYGGEIDIVEGVNNQSPNLITLHTGPGCTMPASRYETGTSRATDCDVYDTGNESCGVSVNAANSYGPSFNAAGGGWYVIERTSAFIKVYFWSRQNPSVPRDVSNPGSTINTDTWGPPTAYFPSSSSCDFATHLSPHNIVIDLDFCGAWAGVQSLYAQAGCPSTCSDFVNNNPSAFTNAYFTFNSLKIFE